MINSGGGRVSWRSAIRRALEAAALHDPQKKRPQKAEGRGEKAPIQPSAGGFFSFPAPQPFAAFFFGGRSRGRGLFSLPLPSCPPALTASGCFWGCRSWSGSIIPARWALRPPPLLVRV